MLNEDLLIRRALLQAAEQDFEAALAEAPAAPPFSLRYLRWEKRFLYDPIAAARTGLRPLWQQPLRAAACFLLIVSLSFAAVMAASPQARAWFTRWVTEWYEDHVTYRFEGSTPASPTIHRCILTYLPNGYAQTNIIDLPGVTSIYYNNDIPEMQIEFSYQDISSGGVENLDNENHIISDITINGKPGKLFAGTTSSINMLLWSDEANQLSFLLMSRVSCDTLIQMAESVVFVN